jgi:hypothetical protein
MTTAGIHYNSDPYVANQAYYVEDLGTQQQCWPTYWSHDANQAANGQDLMQVPMHAMVPMQGCVGGQNVQSQWHAMNASETAAPASHPATAVPKRKGFKNMKLQKTDETESTSQKLVEEAVGENGVGKSEGTELCDSHTTPDEHEEEKDAEDDCGTQCSTGASDHGSTDESAGGEVAASADVSPSKPLPEIPARFLEAASTSNKASSIKALCLDLPVFSSKDIFRPSVSRVKAASQYNESTSAKRPIDAKQADCELRQLKEPVENKRKGMKLKNLKLNGETIERHVITVTASEVTSEHAQNEGALALVEIAFGDGDIYTKDTLLHLRRYIHGEAREVQTLRAKVCPASAEVGWRVGSKGNNTPSSSKNAKLKLVTSETGYKPKRLIEGAATRGAELQRTATSLLNKICPENQRTIVKQMSEVRLACADELNIVIQVIFRKALDEAHYSETYSDMVQSLKNRYPEFPPEAEGEKPISFLRVLLNTCQSEFEQMVDDFAPNQERMDAEEAQEHVAKQKKRGLANMKFIGNLFLRGLLASKVIHQILFHLIGDTFPEEHLVEFACALSTTVGKSLDASGFFANVAGRLLDLKKTTGPNGKAFLSKRLQFMIQDVLDDRESGWIKNCQKEKARKLDDIRRT